MAIGCRRWRSAAADGLATVWDHGAIVYPDSLDNCPRCFRCFQRWEDNHGATRFMERATQDFFDSINMIPCIYTLSLHLHMIMYSFYLYKYTITQYFNILASCYIHIWIRIQCMCMNLHHLYQYTYIIFLYPSMIAAAFGCFSRLGTQSFEIGLSPQTEAMEPSSGGGSAIHHDQTYHSTCWTAVIFTAEALSYAIISQSNQSLNHHCWLFSIKPEMIRHVYAG